MISWELSSHTPTKELPFLFINGVMNLDDCQYALCLDLVELAEH